jgi:hypothetical protein
MKIAQLVQEMIAYKMAFFLQQGEHNDSKEMMPLKSVPSGVAKYNCLFLVVNKLPSFCK